MVSVIRPIEQVYMNTGSNFHPPPQKKNHKNKKTNKTKTNLKRTKKQKEKVQHNKNSLPGNKIYGCEIGQCRFSTLYNVKNSSPQN